MSEEIKPLPLSGYALLRVFLHEAELKTVFGPPDSKEVATDTGNLQFGWDWRALDKKKGTFQVKFVIQINPIDGRPYMARVGTVGTFRKIADVERMPIEEFARLQAVAILLPYARQHLTNLTTNSFVGPYFLPNLNVMSLMEAFDPKDTTGARRQGDRNSGAVATAKKLQPVKHQTLRAGKKR